MLTSAARDFAARVLPQLRRGMTRREVIAIAGVPTDTGGVSRNHTTPCIFVYGDTGNGGNGIELHFGLARDSGLQQVMNAATHEVFTLANVQCESGNGDLK